MNQVYLLSKFDVSSFSKTRDFQTGHFAETSTSRDRCFIFFCNEDRVRISKTKWFSKISEGNKEKGPEQAKVFSGSMNHFMKNAKSFKFLQTNLVANLTLCLSLFKKGLLEAHKSNLEINHTWTLNVVVCKYSKND